MQDRWMAVPVQSFTAASLITERERTSKGFFWSHSKAEVSSILLACIRCGYGPWPIQPVSSLSHQERDESLARAEPSIILSVLSMPSVIPS